MPTPGEIASLANLKDGAIVEQFDAEMREVLRNILDPNAAATARTITLTVKLKPSEDRSRVAVGFKVASRLAAQREQDTVLFIGEDGGGPVATEYNPRQAMLDLQRDEAPRGPVAVIDGKKEAR